MKHLKLYENKSDTVYLLECTDIFISSGHYSSFFKVFETRKDCENYVINICNEMQITLIESDEIDDKIKDKYVDDILNTEAKCKEFAYFIVDELTDGEIESSIRITETTIERNVKINDDVKLRLDSRKYNL